MNLGIYYVLALLSLFAPAAIADTLVPTHMVEIQNNQLVVDGQSQAQIYGAELQYFRLRGGYGKNIPRAQVIALWNKALDRMVEAKMNAISFYIPWDFHEYAEGKFDFTGTVDEDGDGNPDYPSRDLKTFFQLVAQHGIKHIMVRPGPYINAEWGFLGFGAIPEWFHNKFPDSHMQNPYGLKTKLYDYHNPDFLEYSQRWFQALYDQVLKDQIGVGKPITFVQIDNETNFMWQSLYNHDYGPRAIARYQQFLQTRYTTIDVLNKAHQRSWKNWTDIRPPTNFGANNAEDQDWYRFQDFSIYDYLRKIRSMMENIGVREPQVLFTLAESYNATDNGLLPNYSYRNSPGETGMMTVNMYPKTYSQNNKEILHNVPFKVDLDVLAADEASDHYLQKPEEWVLGPEIQAGWWRGIDVSEASRKQTYLSAVGHGLKAMFLYYFHEGYNWEVEWARDRVQPIFDQLVSERDLQDADIASLSDAFWGELQARVDREILVGLDSRHLMQSDLAQDQKLFFDAPLNENADPGAHYAQVKWLGNTVLAPYADFLASSTNVFDDVAIVKDSESHVPSSDPSIHSLLAASDWAGGLLGLFLNEGLNPRILIGELSASFAASKLLVHIDTGLNSPATITKMQEAWNRGQGIVNLLSDSVVRSLGVSSVQVVGSPSYVQEGSPRVPLTFYIDGNGHLQPKTQSGVSVHQVLVTGPIYSYDLTQMPGCVPVLYQNDKVVGYRCTKNAHSVMQIGALFFDDFNSSDYADIPDPANRRLFLRAITKDFGVVPVLGVDQNAARFAAFARKDPQQKLLWITVKTATRTSQQLHLSVGKGALPLAASGNYEVLDLSSNNAIIKINSAEISSQGFGFTIPAEGSTVFAVRPAAQ